MVRKLLLSCLSIKPFADGILFFFFKQTGIYKVMEVDYRIFGRAEEIHFRLNFLGTTDDRLFVFSDIFIEM